MQFPWKIIRKEVLYEGHKHPSGGAGKMRTALLERRSAKSMQINDRMQNFVFFNMSHASEHSESKFYYPGELSNAVLVQSPTHSESTERKSTILTNEEVQNILRSQQQANRWSRKQLFQMNCLIINLWNKQTDS